MKYGSTPFDGLKIVKTVAIFIESTASRVRFVFLIFLAESSCRLFQESLRAEKVYACLSSTDLWEGK